MTGRLMPANPRHGLQHIDLGRKSGDITAGAPPLCSVGYVPQTV
jgi:hypothetical protein